jgi:hypothetical protein
MPAHLLEVHRADAATVGQHFGQPATEAQVAHAATFKPAGLEVLRAADRLTIGSAQCPAGRGAQVQGKDGGHTATADAAGHTNR